MNTKERMLKGDPFMFADDIYGDKVYFLMRQMGDPEDENYSQDAADRGDYGVEICRPIYNWIKNRFNGFKTTFITLNDADFKFLFDGEVEQKVGYERVNFDGLEVFIEAQEKDAFGIFDPDND